MGKKGRCCELRKKKKEEGGRGAKERSGGRRRSGTKKKRENGSSPFFSLRFLSALSISLSTHTREHPYRLAPQPRIKNRSNDGGATERFWRRRRKKDEASEPNFSSMSSSSHSLLLFSYPDFPQDVGQDDLGQRPLDQLDSDQVARGLGAVEIFGESGREEKERAREGVSKRNNRRRRHLFSFRPSFLPPFLLLSLQLTGRARCLPSLLAPGT